LLVDVGISRQVGLMVSCADIGTSISSVMLLPLLLHDGVSLLLIQRKLGHS